MQQKIVSQTEALEITLKIESSQIKDGGTRMMHIHSQLDNMMVQLQDIKKGKELQEDLWCTRCRTDGHTKDNCLTYMKYIASGVPNPLSAHELP